MASVAILSSGVYVGIITMGSSYKIPVLAQSGNPDHQTEHTVGETYDRAETWRAQSVSQAGAER